MDSHGYSAEVLWVDIEGKLAIKNMEKGPKFEENPEKEPIILKWQKGEEVEDLKIAEGFVSGEMGKKLGVRRKIFKTEEGEKSYVYKEVVDLREARDSMQIYRIFKEANLPIVAFAKIIKKRVDGRDEFVIAMEDLTENDKLYVVEVLRSDIPIKVKENMIRALAVIHNNNIYDYHPGISFAIREESAQENKSSNLVDFKITDYANFRTREQHENAIRERMSKPTSFDWECRKDLNQIVSAVFVDDSEREHLANLYWDMRESGDRVFKEL